MCANHCCDGHKEHHHDHHHHHHFHWLGEYTELIFAILSGVFVLSGYLLTFTEVAPWVSWSFYLVAFFCGGIFTALEASQKIFKGEFEIDFLMLVAACGAAYLGKWGEGALLLFLFSLGHALEHYALGKAQKSIKALGKLTPKTALLKEGETITEIPIEKLEKGAEILVKAHSLIATDGVVVKGQSSVNQSSITGESMPVDKFPMDTYTNQNMEDISNEHRVFAGTLNGNSPLVVKVLCEAEDTTISRMIKMVSEAQAKQSPTQKFTKKIEKYYVPSVLVLVVLLCFVFLTGIEPFSDSFYRAMTVLVGASPCALAISTPGTVLSGIARAAQKGVLIKGGGALENLGEVDAIAFDKTGTLTQGKPEITHIIPFGGTTEQELVQMAISLERFTNHPLAVAIVNYGKKQRIDFLSVSDVNVVEGQGVKGTWEETKICIGKVEFLNVELSTQMQEQQEYLEKNGQTIVGISKANSLIGFIGLMDKPKEKSQQVIAQLSSQGIEKILILTGDLQSVATTVGSELGVNESYGGLLPEDKVAVIEELNKNHKKTAMIGDGVNDAPAMATSTVAIAMGAAGSDVALETADIALLSDRLEQLPFAVGLSRKAKQIIKQNLWISLGSIAVIIPLALFGITGMGATVFLHEGITILVILNALRLLYFNVKFS